MRKTLFSLLLTLTVIIVQAQIPDGYYNNASGKTGNELKTALHDIIKGHHVVSYSGLLNAFAYTDCRPNGKIWDIYSNIEYSPSNGVCGEYEQEGDCWNREHTWPQSWFNESTTPRSDLFHVYPTDGYVNGRRSNYPYGEVNNPIYTSGNGSKLGPCVTSGYSGRVFEPIDEYKGDIARGFFYMSVRYYSEDSDWDNSDMTLKSEIKPWAMTMLLRWSDEDPVSDKEIARNNAVYGYQNNRNPFIDHPEYARMIWDPNWQGGVSYNITCATGLSHGSVSAPENALEGSTVAITATPAPGYMVGTYSVYKTESPSTTVAVSSNGTFTMPGYAVTVSATFVPNNTYYNIALGTVNHGSISANTYSAKSGTTITLTATPSQGYSLYSWYVFKTGDMNTTVTVNGNSFTMPAFNVTVMATFVQGSSNGDYVKVTSAPSDWSGEYLIVCEAKNMAFNGTVESGWGRCSPVSISSGTIANNATNNAYVVNISASGNGYSFLLPNGKYMSWTSKEFTESQTAKAYSISLNNGNASISYNSYILQYNYNSGNGGLRSYTNTNQTAIQLYKKTVNITTPTHTIHFNNNGGNGSMEDQILNEFEPTPLTANTFTKEGFVFDGWNTESDGTGIYYSDEATVTLLDDLTLYAQWNPLYTVTLATVANGSISANPLQAIEETIITLTATPDEGYEFDHWTVTYGENSTIEVVDNEFEMPAANVTVSAAFVYVGQPFTQQYYLITSANQLVAGRTYLIVNTSAGKALGTTQNSNNRSEAGVSVNNGVIENIGADVCELTLGSTTGAWTLYDADNNGYLYAAGGTGSNNYLKTQTSLTNEGKWSITFNNGNATIKTIVTTVARHTIMYNSGSHIFSCYASGQQAVQLFIRAEEYDHPANETIAQIFSFDKHVISNGAILTVTGTVACNEPNQLVIEDGAQLIHHNDGVKATFKKNIDRYVGDSGWYTLATPFTAFDPSPIVTESFDLYAYDEDGDNNGLEWTNYKADNFNPNPCDGYLFAHDPGTTLRMTGTLNNGDFSQTVSLGFDNSQEAIKGFNLLGNPTAHTITFTKSNNVADGYYYLDNNDAWTYEPGNTVPAGRGFLVKADDAGQSVTLNPTAKCGETETHGATPLLRIDVDGEQAFVKLSDGSSMPLLDLKGRHSCVYLSQDGKGYIMLANEKHGNVNLCYRPKGNGRHTLSIATEGNGLDYLHLIDRLTGNDINLLESLNYSFEAHIGDAPERFQLVFDPKKIVIPN
jgi:uncharacterized repeat protein (TIGR02543 family)